MSKSFTLSKISLKDIVTAVLVLYITYKLGLVADSNRFLARIQSSHIVESTGIEPARHALVVVNQMSADLLPKYKMSSLMTCSGHDGRIVYGHIQVGDFICTSQIQLKYGSLMKSGAPGEPGCNKKSVHLSSRTGVSYIYLYQ